MIIRSELWRGVALLALLAFPAAAGPLEDGQAAYDKGDYKTAAQDFTVAASQGDDRARAHLGTMFAFGLGVPKDGKQAAFWLSMAAEHNNAEAEAALGKLYMDGQLVPQDLDQALSLFQRAADQNMPIAQTWLAELYMKGTPKVKPDYPAAVRYFTLAANQNEAEGQYWLGFIYYTGQFGLKQDYKASAGLFVKAAAQGNSAAQTYAGTQYDKGLGVEQDARRAIVYYQLAAVQGNLQGLSLLGEHYATGAGVTQDYQRAYLLLNMAASQIGEPLRAIAIKERDAAGIKISPAQLASAQKLGAFCGAAGFLLCLDDSVSVDTEAADPQTALARLRANIQAQQQQQAQNSPQQQPQQQQQQPRNDGNARPADGKPQLEATGTGFFINNSGDIVTAAHVIKNCGEMRTRGLKLKVTAADEASDIAVLSSDAKPANFVKLRGGRGPKVGEAVVAVGFPLHGFLGEDAIVTTGIVSSLAGGGNDRRLIQVSAPLQPGNSGGPDLGEDGALVGISDAVTSTLEMAKELGGVMTQNVNFAVSVGTLQSFLNARQVPYTLSDGNGAAKSSAQIASEAQRYTMLLECWK